jgi:hypothetical protein
MLESTGVCDICGSGVPPFRRLEGVCCNPSVAARRETTGRNGLRGIETTYAMKDVMFVSPRICKQCMIRKHRLSMPWEVASFALFSVGSVASFSTGAFWPGLVFTAFLLLSSLLAFWQRTPGWMKTMLEATPDDGVAIKFKDSLAKRYDRSMFVSRSEWEEIEARN